MAIRLFALTVTDKDRHCRESYLKCMASACIGDRFRHLLALMIHTL